MIPAPVGNQCPVCAGRMREGAIGEAAYRVRVKAESIPMVRKVAGLSVSHLLIGINVLVFLAMMATGAPQANRTLIRFGALIRPLPEDELWRLVASMFIHIGLIHLAFNMWALYIFGPAIEQRYGAGRFLMLYFGTGLTGAAASLTFNSGFGIAAGASGAVFGILGAWIAFFIRHRDSAMAQGHLQQLLMLVGLNLAFGFVIGGIDNLAHLGGLAGGVLLGSAFEVSRRLRGRAPLVAGIAAFLFVVAVAAAMIMPKTCPVGGVTVFDRRAAVCGLSTSLP